MSDWNQQIIDEFRANDGRVGGQFEGAPLLLLHTKGAKSGEERVHPVMYQPLDRGVAVFASKAGAPDNPDWYHNLVANPTVTVEIGDERYSATAKEVTGPERDRLYAEQASRMPGFAEYEVKAGDRVIPVVTLERA